MIASDIDDDFQFSDLDAADSLLTRVETVDGSNSGDLILATLKAVAEFFGYHVQTIKEWHTASNPMPGREGHYSLREIVRWRLQKHSHSDLNDAQRRQNLRKTELANEAAELELNRERGNLLDRRDVDLWATVALTECRESIMQLPEMLAASAPAELKNFVRDETERHCRDTLTATCRRLELRELNDGELPE